MSQTVMIVEDDDDIVESVSMVLEDAGYRVVKAPNGREALSLLADADPLPSVILLDLMMPVMSGFEFREAQRADPLVAAIPVVLMTADGHVSEKAARLEAAAALGKPFEVDALLDTVGRFASKVDGGGAP